MTYISSIQLFLEKLSILFLIRGGQPPRAPELLSIRTSNSSETGLRNIFIEKGLFYFVTFYYKSYTISGSTKIIYQYLLKEIGEIAIYYIWLDLPFLSRISFQIFQKPLSDYLFQNLLTKKRKITSDRLRTILRRETLAGLGIAINPSDYRHISIGISR